MKTDYTLVSPDTYEYLDNTKPEDFANDPLLEEQEELEDLFDEDETPRLPDNGDDSDAYQGTLFDYTDEEEEDPPEVQSDSEEDVLMFNDDENDDIIVNENAVEKSEEKQKTVSPPLLEKITSFCKDRYNEVVQYINRSGEQELNELNQMVEKTRDAFLSDKKDKMFSIPSTDITVAIVSNRNDPMLETQRLEYIATEMILKGKGFWNVLFLTFRQTGEMANAEFVSLSKSFFTEGEWKIIQMMAEKIKGMKK